MFYIYNADMTAIVAVVADFPKEPSICDARNIPKGNCEIIDGQLYDNREIDYWRAKRFDDVEKFEQSCSNTIVKIDGLELEQTREKVDSLAVKLAGVNLDDVKGKPPYIEDANGKRHVMTKARMETIIRGVRDAYEDWHCRAIDARYAIGEATTIEQLQAIVI